MNREKKGGLTNLLLAATGRLISFRLCRNGAFLPCELDFLDE